jgi:hypothetical protein
LSKEVEALKAWKHEGKKFMDRDSSLMLKNEDMKRGNQAEQ